MKINCCGVVYEILDKAYVPRVYTYTVGGGTAGFVVAFNLKRESLNRNEVTKIRGYVGGHCPGYGINKRSIDPHIIQEVR